MSLELADDRMCFVCGKDNKAGFRLDFGHPEKGRLTAAVKFEKHHQGYQNIVHGGLLATLLDEMVVNLAWVEKKPCVTVEITVRLKKAAKVGEEVFLEGRLSKEESRLIVGTSEARNAAGEVLAEATVKCVRIRPKTDNS